MTDELIYPPRLAKRDTPTVDAVRGFVFTSGVAWFKQRGVYERYESLLPPALRGRINTLTATDWVEIDDAHRAYAACDGLELSVQDQVELGRVVSSANNGIILRTVVRLVGKVASPWTGLGQADRLWQRSNRGGAIAVYKIASRQARVEFWKVPLARSPFFVTSMRGALGAAIEPFCDRVLVVELPELTTSDGFALRVIW
jgi:hypothetical protein